MNLRSLDVKLLIVFDAIMRERSMTRAANYIGMSQPSISGALRKLRDVFGDQLFIRVPGGVRPTLRAQEVAPLVREVLSLLQSAVEPASFSPQGSQHTFQVAVGDHSAMLVLPELHKRLREKAPGIRLRVHAKRDYLYVSQLDNGEVHFVLGHLYNCPNRLPRVSLFQDHHVCVMRPTHPLANGHIGLEDYLEAEHVEMSHPGEVSAFVDIILAQRGLERRISVTINQSMLAPSILHSTDVIMTTFSQMARRLPAFAGLHVAPLPFETGPVLAELAWPNMLDSHPAHQWVKDQILDICSDLRQPRT